MIFVIGQSPILHMTALGWHNSMAEKGIYVVRYFFSHKIIKTPRPRLQPTLYHKKASKVKTATRKK